LINKQVRSLVCVVRELTHAIATLSQLQNVLPAWFVTCPGQSKIPSTEL